jgi:D-alanyl-D-alanine carboxypeptidase/D-alanyl-D-alanine-endopeptidase (penicillin-binding protein 4)
MGIALRCVYLTVLLLLPGTAISDPADPLMQSLAATFRGASSKSALAVYDLKKDSYIFGQNQSKLLKPASILKIVTASAALAELGPEYRFQTGLWYFGKNGQTIDNLYVRGGGDPSFTTEDLWILARRVYHTGIKRIKRLAIDDSYFHGAKLREGQRAYEAGSSAVPLNFNTVTLHVCPTLPGQPASVIPDPWELSFGRSSSITTGQIRTVAKGRSTYRIDEQACDTSNCAVRFRLSGQIVQNSACVEVYRSVRSPNAYFLNTFANFLNYLGVRVDRVTTTPAPVPQSARQLTSYNSRALTQIVRDMNLYSSNFIAEQLLTTFGFSDASENYRQRGQGLRKMEEFLTAIGVPPADFQIVDASGLSHDNRVTADAILKTLLWVYHQENIGSEFLTSLPVAGRSGTLKRRTPARSGLILRAKTGTLTGVSSLAGFVNSKSGTPYAFVVIQNKTKGKRAAEQVEDRVVATLYNS